MPFLAALLAVALAGPADVASLTTAADVVVRARVVRLTSAWVDGTPASGLIATTVELQPTEWWKRAAQTGTLSVRVPGGVVGDLGQLSPGAPSFTEGEEVVVFLRRLAPRQHLYSVERWSLGKFSVRAQTRALRSREGVTCRGCRPGEPDELSLKELRERVRAAQPRAGGAR